MTLQLSNNMKVMHFIFLYWKQLTVDTPSFLSLSAVWHVEEGQKIWQELVLIRRHLTVERTAVNWDQLKRQFHATKQNVVSIFSESPRVRAVYLDVKKFVYLFYML